VKENVSPESLIPESNRPEGTPGSPEVALWVSLFQVQVTVSPTWMDTSAGEKVKAPPGPTSTLKVVAASVWELAKMKLPKATKPSKTRRVK
jgi:hypothetical protein